MWRIDNESNFLKIGFDVESRLCYAIATYKLSTLFRGWGVSNSKFRLQDPKSINGENLAKFNLFQNRLNNSVRERPSGIDSKFLAIVGGEEGGYWDEILCHEEILRKF